MNITQIYSDSCICHPKEEEKYNCYYLQRNGFEMNFVLYLNSILLLGFEMKKIKLAIENNWTYASFTR